MVNKQIMEVYKLVFSPIEINTYIIADNSGNCAIIDCGCYEEAECIELTDFIAAHSFKPVTLLNTHCHLDHVFGNGFILSKYGLKTISHAEDEPNRINAPRQSLLFGLEMETPPEPASFIQDGEKVFFGNEEMIALHVPGHTAGSIAFYSEKHSIVFTGDALFAGSIGRTDLPGGNFDTLINSIRSKLFTLHPETVVYPGHGPKTTIERELRNNPFFRY